MQYLMLIVDGPEFEQREEDGDDAIIRGWVAEMDGRGVRKVGNRLRPSEDARTVRVRDGELIVTDGPFTEGKDYIGGFDLIECADLDEAIEIASKHPAAANGGIDIRPVWPLNLQ